MADSNHFAMPITTMREPDARQHPFSPSAVCARRARGRFYCFDPPGVEQDFLALWRTLPVSVVPDVVWIPHNGGHWIASAGIW